MGIFKKNESHSLWNDAWFWIGVFIIISVIYQLVQGTLFASGPEATQQEAMGRTIMGVVEIILGPFFIIGGIRSSRKE